MRVLIVIFVAVLSTLWGCSKAPAPAQQATVTLNDGSTFSGTVTSSSSSAISLQASTGEARTYPMSQVASVRYAAPVAAPTASSPAPVVAPATTPSPAAPPPVEAAAPQPAAVPQPAPQPVVEFRTIPAGTTIAVRNNDTIDSQRVEVGQTFPGVVERDVLDTGGRVAIPRGANATLVVRSASGQGKLQGQSDLAVDVSSVKVGGRAYRLETSDFVEKGKQGLGTNKRTGEFVGGGAALGGIIGAIAGGGKGAAIGALSGGAPVPRRRVSRAVRPSAFRRKH
jgi:hypothetical protein